VLASNQAVTASAEIEFVQFQDGSTWGDSDTETEAFQARSATLQKLRSLQRVYAEQGEKAFLDALAEPTSTFAAWGCSACSWIEPGFKVGGKPPLTIKTAFNKHDCAKYPRHTDAAPKKPPQRGLGRR
jgi:hypothetical protein